jgi:hypothetical protein
MHNLNSKVDINFRNEIMTHKAYLFNQGNQVQNNLVQNQKRGKRRRIREAKLNVRR